MQETGCGYYIGASFHAVLRTRPMFSLLRKTLTLSFLAAALLAGYAFWYAMSPLSLASLPVDFRIEPGSGLRSAARQMEASGVALGSLRFEALAQVLGKS